MPDMTDFCYTETVTTFICRYVYTDQDFALLAMAVTQGMCGFTCCFHDGVEKRDSCFNPNHCQLAIPKTLATTASQKEGPKRGPSIINSGTSYRKMTRCIEHCCCYQCPNHEIWKVAVSTSSNSYLC